MNRAAVAFSAVLFAVCTARAAPDLEVTIVEATLVPGTTLVQVVVRVHNKSTETANMEDTGYGPIDVLLFQDLAAAPNPSGTNPDGTPFANVLPSIMAAGAKEDFIWELDYEVPGTYQLWAIVDSIAFHPDYAQFAWKEASKTNNIVGPITVVVPKPDVTTQAPDLVVTVATTVNASQVKYSVTVKNQGLVVAQNGAKVDILIDTPGGQCPPPGWLQKPITLFGNTFSDVGPLAIGAETTVEIIAKPGVGIHTSCVMVDLDDVVNESDETNNFAGPASYEITDPGNPSCADLDVNLFVVEVDGAEVTYTTRVKNIGATASSPVVVDLYYASITAPVPAQLPDHVWPLLALAPGDEMLLEHTWTSPNNAERTAWVAVDLDQQGQECSFTNNSDGPYPYEVLTVPDRPDLVIESFDWAPAGDDLCYTIAVENQGPLAAVAAQLDVFFSLAEKPSTDADLGDVPSAFVELGDLAPGASVTKTICWKNAVEGDHSTWAVVDFLGFVTESDETNNIYGPEPVKFVKKVTDGPELAVLDFKGKVRCTAVDYVVKVCNRGDQDAQKFQVDIYYDALENPGFTGQKYGPGDETVIYGTTDGEPRLKAGECMDILIQRVNAPSGTFQSWVVVDTNLEVEEKTVNNPNGEGNNIAKVSVTIDAEGCQCLSNELISATCLCGLDTVSSGYCCNDDWQPGPFDVCVPEDSGDVSNPDGENPGGDASDGGEDDFGNEGSDGISGPYGVFDTSGGLAKGVSESCLSAPAGRAGSSWSLSLLLLGALLVAGRLWRARG